MTRLGEYRTKMNLIRFVSLLFGKKPANSAKFFCWNRRTFATVEKTNVLERIQELGLDRRVRSIDTEEMFERIDVVNASSHLLDEVTSLRVIQMPRKDFDLFWKLLDNSRRKSSDTDEDRFRALSEMLNISLPESCALFAKYHFLLRSNVSTIRKKITILTDGGFTAEDLMKDLWIVTNTSAVLTERLKIIKRLGICPMKTWMLRRSEDELLSFSKHLEHVRTVLAPHSDKVGYLKQRLHLSDSQMDVFIRRHPSVLHVQVTKIKSILDFLYSEGFNSRQIYCTPRILCHSISTIKERLNFLRELSIDFKSLSTLCKNRRQFHEFIKSYKETNKR